MTRNRDNFPPLRAYQGESVSFENSKKGDIIGIGKVGKSHYRTIKNMYYVKGLKHSLLNVSQICDNGN